MLTRVVISLFVLVYVPIALLANYDTAQQAWEQTNPALFILWINTSMAYPLILIVVLRGLHRMDWVLVAMLSSITLSLMLFGQGEIYKPAGLMMSAILTGWMAVDNSAEKTRKHS